MANYNKLTTRHNAGTFDYLDPYSDTVAPGLNEQKDATQCIHCAYTWVVEPGSKRERGYCLNCAGPTCGKERCETVCQHIEAFIEQIEAKGRMEENMRQLRGGFFD